jgi:hypothetical protein
LKLYSSVTKQKLSSILGINQEKFSNLLDNFLYRRKLNFDNKSEFFKTVIRPLNEGISETRLRIVNDQIEIDEPEEKEIDFSHEYKQCFERIVKIDEKLDEFIFV